VAEVRGNARHVCSAAVRSVVGETMPERVVVGWQVPERVPAEWSRREEPIRRDTCPYGEGGGTPTGNAAAVAGVVCSANVRACSPRQGRLLLGVGRLPAPQRRAQREPRRILFVRQSVRFCARK